MSVNKRIVITGAAGFIASCLVSKLNELGYGEQLILVDDFSVKAKEANFAAKKFGLKIHRDDFFEYLDKNASEISFVFHIGARTDTTLQNVDIFDSLNLNYSKEVWKLCSKHRIPMIYASSAATYGAGEHGYQDNNEEISLLKPLNPYGQSKQDFDVWALAESESPPFWAGFKFFNVYGPNEYHKGRMASVIFHAFNQIKASGTMKLFRSHRADFTDGGQSRDFVYVKDLIDVLIYFYENQQHSGIYNLGSGKARSFLDLVKGVFHAMQTEANIGFIDTPEDIRETYQYFTEADLSNLRKAGYRKEFTELESGIEDYVKNYLVDSVYC